MIPLIVFGAGGHARVVIDACRSQGMYAPVACLGESKHGSVLGVPVRSEHDAAQMLRDGTRHAIVAIGHNGTRERVARQAVALGFELATVVSAQAYVSPDASIGAGSVVMAGAVVQPGARVGGLAIINTGATIDHDCTLDEAVHVAPGATLCGTVAVGSRVWIGAGATVIENTAIERDAFVCAGAVVVRGVPEAGSRLAGVPARLLDGRP